MSVAVKLTASAKTASDVKLLADTKESKSLRTAIKNYSPQEKAQRRKWGVETGAVRSIHARKF